MNGKKNGNMPKGAESPGTGIPEMSVKVKVKPRFKARRNPKRGMRQVGRKEARY